MVESLASLCAIALVLSVVDGKPTTTSLDIARHFNRPHDEVLRRIRTLLEQLPADHLRNFTETVTERVNPSGGAPIKSPAYRITRDGFTLLAMGFTGKKALTFKLAYIDAFNKMEAQLSTNPLQLTPPPAPPLPPEPELDVHARLLTGQSAPVPYPAEVNKAIDAAAWRMAQECHGLVQEHLRRRVAHGFVYGHPVKQVNVRGAVAEINKTTLGHCLTREATFYYEHATTGARMALVCAQTAVAELEKQLAEHNKQAPWAGRGREL